LPSPASDHNPPTSISQVAGITSMNHHTCAYFGDRLSLTFCLGQPQTSIHLLSSWDYSLFYHVWPHFFFSFIYFFYSYVHIMFGSFLPPSPCPLPYLSPHLPPHHHSLPNSP
jgi:hypothetical protein